MHFIQQGAEAKCMIADSIYAFGNDDFRKGILEERIVSDFFYARFNGQRIDIVVREVGKA